MGTNIPTVETPAVAWYLDKGGTGKTTNAAHTAAAASELGGEVLAIDLAGKQGDLGKHFGIWADVQEDIDVEDDWPNIATAMKTEFERIADRLGDGVVDELIYTTEEGVDVIPAHPGLDGLDDDLGNIDDADERYSRLPTFLAEYIDPLGYDVIILDLPGMANHITYNGIAAAGDVAAPVEAGRFEAEQAGALVYDLERFASTFETPAQLTMLVLNKLDRRTTLAASYREQYAEDFDGEFAPEAIPWSQDIRNAAEDGMTVFALEDPSSTAEEAREAFIANTDELLARIRGELTA